LRENEREEIMNVIDKALETQLKNIQTKTKRSLDELSAIVKKSGLTKHGEIREMLKRDLGLGHGDANRLAHFVMGADRAKGASTDEVLDEIYSGGKAELRPIHYKLIAAIETFGPFETAPKKAYVSLRRKKQFAMIGPGTRSRVEVGLNAKGLEPGPRLVSMPAGGMCQYKVFVSNAGEVDDELLAWIRQAFDDAGEIARKPKS
jgi:hypothetical protein